MNFFNSQIRDHQEIGLLYVWNTNTGHCPKNVEQQEFDVNRHQSGHPAKL